jgi:hypothetical protein
MKRFMIATLALLLAAPAFAAEPKDTPKGMTNSEALQVLAGLRALDGHQVVLKDQTLSPAIPWVFENGPLRLTIANDVTVLTSVEKSIDEARQSLIKEALVGKPPGFELKSGTPEFDAFMKQFTELLDRPAGKDVAHIKATDLKLDRNEIATSVLAALAPILDK